jgi:hypothetical protein
MIAAVVLVITLLGFIGGVTEAYKMTAIARHRDQARALLQSWADEFLRDELQTKDAAGVITVNGLFQTNYSAGPLGQGTYLVWNNIVGGAGGLVVPLGGDPQSPSVTVTRWVRDIDEVNGGVAIDHAINSAAGRLLIATFTAQYSVNNRQQTVSLTVARATQ